MHMIGGPMTTNLNIIYVRVHHIMCLYKDCILFTSQAILCFLQFFPSLSFSLSIAISRKKAIKGYGFNSMAAYSSFPSMPESVCEGLEFSSDTKKILLMALMEETQEEHDQYYADDRLMSMIQSLEAEISSTTSSVDPYQSCDMEVGQVDGQDCSTSPSISFTTDCDDMEVVSESSSSSSFDEDMMMNTWSLCAAGGDDSTSDDYYDSSNFYYEILLENYLPQEATDYVVF